MKKSNECPLPALENVVAFICTTAVGVVVIMGALVGFDAASQGHALFGLGIALATFSLSAGALFFGRFLFSLR